MDMRALYLPRPAVVGTSAVIWERSDMRAHRLTYGLWQGLFAAAFRAAHICFCSWLGRFCRILMRLEMKTGKQTGQSRKETNQNACNPKETVFFDA